MGLPGFTADSTIYRSCRHYGVGPSPAVPANGITLQWSDRLCFDRQCLSYCEERAPWDAARCYEVCQVPCNPYEPPEMLPAG
jgi:hypothetical protein